MEGTPASRMPDRIEEEDRRKAEGVRREGVIRYLAGLGRIPKHEQAQASQQLSLSRAQLLKLVKQYRDSPITGTLVPKPRGVTPGTKRLAAEVEVIVAEGVKREDRKAERLSVQAITSAIAHDCRAARVPAPSRKAVQARILAQPPRDRLAAREGGNVARSRYGLVNRFRAPDSVLELVQVDHTKIDIQVVDELTRSALGRPWLTLVLDVASRVVLGFHVSLDPPSSNSVAQALSQAVLPKDDWLWGRGISLLWPVFGLPATLHTDNAKEFHAAALRRGCHNYGIDIRYRPRGRPHFGGHIERLMGTLMKRLHSLPGTTFSNVRQKGDYASEHRAILTLPEIERIIALEILGRYHNEVHSTLQRTPISAWTEGASAKPPKLPSDTTTFAIDLLPAVERIVRRDGIHLFNLTYFDGAIELFVGGAARSQIVRFNPNDLSVVFLQAPDGTYLRLPHADLKRPPTTLWEHRLARRTLIQEGRRIVDEDAIFTAIEEQRRLLAAAADSSKAARRLSARQKAAHLVRSKPGSIETVTTTSEQEEVCPSLDPGSLWRIETWT